MVTMCTHCFEPSFSLGIQSPSENGNGTTVFLWIDTWGCHHPLWRGAKELWCAVNDRYPQGHFGTRNGSKGATMQWFCWRFSSHLRVHTTCVLHHGFAGLTWSILFHLIHLPPGQISSVFQENCWIFDEHLSAGFCFLSSNLGFLLDFLANVLE